jgi:hypothetical protein
MLQRSLLDQHSSRIASIERVCLCANTAIREVISNKLVEPKLLTIKNRAKKHGKGGNNGGKAKTTKTHSNLNATIPTTVLITRSRARREETTMNQKWESREILNDLVVSGVAQQNIVNQITLMAVRLLTKTTTSTCSTSLLDHLRGR